METFLLKEWGLSGTSTSSNSSTASRIASCLKYVSNSNAIRILFLKFPLCCYVSQCKILYIHIYSKTLRVHENMISDTFIHKN